MRQVYHGIQVLKAQEKEIDGHKVEVILVQTKDGLQNSGAYTITHCAQPSYSAGLNADIASSSLLTGFAFLRVRTFQIRKLPTCLIGCGDFARPLLPQDLTFLLSAVVWQATSVEVW